MIDNDNPQINVTHWAAVAVFATFSGLRHLLGILGLIAIVAAVVFWNSPAQVTPVRAEPVCNREFYKEPYSSIPGEWRGWFRTPNNPTLYVQEANGTGFCRIKKDEQWINIGGLYKVHWYEVPTKYGEIVAQSAPPKEDTHRLLAIILGAVGGCFLFGLWLPATILAAVARRWRNETL